LELGRVDSDAAGFVESTSRRMVIRPGNKVPEQKFDEILLTKKIFPKKSLKYVAIDEPLAKL
jgi:hypothetical protein